MALTAAEVQKYYLGFYGRPADPVGLAYWMTQDKAAADAGFAASAEYAALYSGMTVQQRVNQVYKNVLGRDADPAGLLYWSAELTAGRVTTANLVTTMMTSALEPDVTTIANRITYSTAFTAAVDTTAEIVGYSGDTAAAAARAAMAPITTAATLATAQASLATSVATVVGAGTNTSGQTFTLTDKIDTFTGGGGNDVFIGDNATASGADQLTGGDGADTMKLYGTVVAPSFSGIESVYLNAPAGDFNVSGKSDVTSLEVDSQTMAAAARVYTVTTGQTLLLTSITDNTASGNDVDVSGNTPTTLNVTLNGVGNTTAAVDVDFNGTALSTLNLTASGNDSIVGWVNTGAKVTTLSIAGDKNLTLNNELANITTVTVSSTGGAKVVLDDTNAKNLTVTGGAGNDRFDLQDTGDVNNNDKIDAGNGTDTLRLGDDAAFTQANFANVKNFEILEVRETAAAAAAAYDVDNIIANNALTGVIINQNDGGADGISVTDINDGAKGNIKITSTDDNAGDNITVTVKSHVSGGTSDAATVIIDNDANDDADGVDVDTLNFANVDILTVQTVKSATVGVQTNSVGDFDAADVEKLIFSGTDALTFTLGTSGSVSEVDATGMAEVFTFDVNGSGNASILVKGGAKADVITVDNAAQTGTLYTGGGSDTFNVAATDGGGAASAAETLILEATALNTADVKAGNAITVNIATAVTSGDDAFYLKISDSLADLLKNGGTVLGTTAAATVDVLGNTLGADTNVAVTVAAGVHTFQIDLNGDGTYNATDDFQITLTGAAALHATVVNFTTATNLFTFDIA